MRNKELPDGSYFVSDIQDYCEYILKNMRQLLIILQQEYTSIKYKIGQDYI